MGSMQEPNSLTGGPLAGLRVIDASNVLAGPICCQMLGDFGADVVKIEKPGIGDTSRGNSFTKDGEPLWWKFLARNKRSVGLYLGDPEAAEIFRELVKTADVVVENFRPGTLERWGLSPASLLEINPRLIVTRISGFGQTGPYAEKRAFGTLIECMSGYAHLTGYPDRPPTLPPFGIADHIAGATAASAIGMALYERERSGQGQVIDLALLQPMMAAMGPIFLWSDQLGYIPERDGNRTDSAAPRGIFETSDGKWVGVSASSDDVAVRMMKMMGAEELVTQPWFAGGANRSQHADELEQVVERWMKQHNRDEALEISESWGVPMAPVYNSSELMDDPHVVATDMVCSIDDAQLGPIRMQNVPFRLSRTPGSIRFSAPDLGEQTDEVLVGELGIDPERLDQLRERGVAQ